MPFRLPETEAAPAHRYGSYASWDYRPHTGSPVDMVWRSRIDRSTQARHILLPFVEPSLILRCRLGKDGSVLDYDMRLSCACPDGGEYVPAAYEEQFAVRLAPEGASALDLDPAVGADVELRELPRAVLRRLETAMSLADKGEFTAAWRDMARAFSAVLNPEHHKPASRAMALLRRGAGRLAPAQLAEHLDISARHLRRTFSDSFGASPRTVARRLRLTAALIAGERGERSDWAGVAVDHGFSDQSHLIRECRDILGQSPARLVAERRKMAVSFNS